MAALKFRPREVLLVVVPALIWWGLHEARPRVIDPVCAEAPETCTKENVRWPDRVSIGIEGGNSDFLSDYAQFAAGTLAVLGPAAFRVIERAPFAVAVMDPILLVQAAFINAAFNEAVRLVVQRPRPYVYRDPRELGLVPGSYTSFYSGHTSFAAVSATHLILLLGAVGRRRFARKGMQSRTHWVRTALSGLSVGLVFLTGLFRVLSGYHFITDVLVAALAGTLAALAVHKRASLQPVDLRG